MQNGLQTTAYGSFLCRKATFFLSIILSVFFAGLIMVVMSPNIHLRNGFNQEETPRLRKAHKFLITEMGNQLSLYFVLKFSLPCENSKIYMIMNVKRIYKCINFTYTKLANHTIVDKKYRLESICDDRKGEHHLH